MSRSRLIVRMAIVASIIGLIHATMLHAQEPRRRLTVNLALSTQYPDRFQVGCGNPLAAAPSIRGEHHVLGILTAELGISGMLQIPPGPYCSNDALPLMDGDIVRHFTPRRGNLSVAGEARVVLTPRRAQGGAVRVIGGGAWYPARRSPAWILGAGYGPLTTWGALVVDVEYWRVGVAYDLERFRLGAPRELLGNGREWQGFVQVRFGFRIWSS